MSSNLNGKASMSRSFTQITFARSRSPPARSMAELDGVSPFACAMIAFQCAVSVLLTARMAASVFACRWPSPATKTPATVSAIKTPRMAMTTSSSTIVKPDRRALMAAPFVTRLITGAHYVRVDIRQVVLTLRGVGVGVRHRPGTAGAEQMIPAGADDLVGVGIVEAAVRRVDERHRCRRRGGNGEARAIAGRRAVVAVGAQTGTEVE